MTYKLGSTADGARFTRERARALTPEEGLSVLEELRQATYDAPSSTPTRARFCAV